MPQALPYLETFVLVILCFMCNIWALTALFLVFSCRFRCVSAFECCSVPSWPRSVSSWCPSPQLCGWAFWVKIQFFFKFKMLSSYWFQSYRGFFFSFFSSEEAINASLKLPASLSQMRSDRWMDGLSLSCNFFSSDVYQNVTQIHHLLSLLCLCKDWSIERYVICCLFL